MYNPMPGMSDERKAEIGLEMRNISREMCRTEIGNFKQKFDVITVR